MDIFFKIIQTIVSAIINIVILGGIIIVLAWAIWDVTPQTSITKTAYFFSESWHLITGKPRSEQAVAPVTEKQLKPSQERTRYLEAQ